MTSKLDAALGYWERGWVVIPIDPGTKRPTIKWLAYQDRQPTYDEIVAWWEEWPDADIALVTGALTGLVIVDCDNEAALEAALEAGMHSPIRVKTKRGTHLYFEHPRDGIRRGPRAGVNSRGADWPKIEGLDFRGDGSYALLPPSTNYTWDMPEGLEVDDAPVWRDWKPELAAAGAPGEFSFASLDLSTVRHLTADDLMSEWDKTAKYVRDKFPSSLKIPSGAGNGRNERVMRYISECVMDGYFGDELRVRGYAFMREFFVENLPEPEFQATVRSIEEAERRNHPERFDAAGKYIPRPGREPVTSTVVTPEAVKAPERKLFQMADADGLVSAAEKRKYLIEPWLPPQTIVQVYGYSGHGKSLFLQHAMGALAAGKKYFGPFEIGQPAKVLYLDFENGMATLGRRLQDLRSAHGDTQDRLQVWTPYVEGAAEINLNTAQGLAELGNWINWAKPDVVVIDTLRSAYPGLQENDAAEWAKLNQLALRIRNAGMACVMVHHSNKPGDNGVGREAGSTNQLTVLETQIRVTQVFQDKETATIKAGIHDASYGEGNEVFPLLRAKLPEGFRLSMVMEVRYGKVREWSDLHDMVQWIGLAAHDETEEVTIVSSRSTKQRAKDMALDRYKAPYIAEKLERPLRLIKEWLEIE